MQRNLKFSPHSVKRALENSAQYLDSVDPFAQGCGLLQVCFLFFVFLGFILFHLSFLKQVEKAFEHLCQFSGSIERDVRFSIQCGVNNTKGIHMRNGLQEKAKDYPVYVEPIFREDCDPSVKINFNMKLSLVCSEPWVQVPTHLDLVNISRVLSIRIDPTSLAEGVHFTR